MKNITLKRWALYFVGILILCFGLIMNQKSNLGVSPIISVSYVAHEITGISYGDTTFVWYFILVIAEYILLKDWKVFLQLPFSIVFTRFMNLFSALINITPTNLFTQILVLLVGIVCTGIGASITLNMEIVPNPGDGIVDAVAQTIHKEMGLTKNIFDCCCFIATIIIGFIFNKPFSGIGLGTILAVLLVGRVIAIYNHFFLEEMRQFASIQK